MATADDIQINSVMERRRADLGGRRLVVKAPLSVGSNLLGDDVRRVVLDALRFAEASLSDSGAAERRISVDI